MEIKTGENRGEATPEAKKPAALSFEKAPINSKLFVTFYQTSSKNYFEWFELEDEANEHAREAAERGHEVAIFGPQIGVAKLPPKEVTVQKPTFINASDEGDSAPEKTTG